MTKARIRATANGPYLFDGPAIMTDADGNESEIQGKTVALCRCGQSDNKPFCDGTHREVGFEATKATVQQVEAVD